MRSDTLTNVLEVDAGANAVGGIALIVAGGWLAEPMGLAAAWPLWIAGVLLVVNGIENRLVARDPSPPALKALAAVDLVFAVAVVALAVANPTGAETWARWALVVVADAAAVVGIAKVVGARSFSGAEELRSAAR